MELRDVRSPRRPPSTSSMRIAGPRAEQARTENPTTPEPTPTWTPSGADIARKAPTRPDLPVVDTVGVRRHGILEVIDGARWVEERLAEIAKLTKLGVPVTVVFDLDNTVFDTRHRTLHAARAFDARNGTDHFAGLTLGDVAIDGQKTAAARGLPDDVIERFAAFWEQHFWTPENLAQDVPIDAVVQLVKQAQRAGAEVKFLTGRTAVFHEASLAQLRKAGIAVDDEDVVCKPDLATRTAPFKEQHLRAWACSSEIGFFVTEGVRDLAHVAGVLPEVQLLRLACSFEDGSTLPKVPVLPGLW